MRPPPCQDPLLGSLQPTQSNPCFDDRIKIETLGLLISGLSLDDLRRGIPVILEEAASLHLPPPLFEEVGLRFRVTLPLGWGRVAGQGQTRRAGASDPRSELCLRGTRPHDPPAPGPRRDRLYPAGYSKQ